MILTLLICHLVKPNNFDTIFDCIKDMSIMICVNIFLKSLLYQIMNSLPFYIITANTVGIFEKRLDQFWSNLACFFWLYSRLSRSYNEVEVKRN